MRPPSPSSLSPSPRQKLTFKPVSNVYLKLENLQPSGSFKSRGIGNLMMRSSKSPAHFYCSSGGNAGLACATSALSLRRPATIVIPTITTELMKRRLTELGVEVHQFGRNWAEADRFLREELLAEDMSGEYVPPFDHQHVWDGAATIVDELREQMDTPIDGIVCSVGGGGLVNGIMQGIYDHSWPGAKPSVVAVETQGADSLNASVVAGRHTQLPEMTSIATSLGATRVCPQTWTWSQHPDGLLQSMVVSDADAAVSCVLFANDSRHLVEVACGATLAAAYGGHLRGLLGKGMSDEEWRSKTVVLVVCGGSNVTLDMLQAYRAKYGPESNIRI